MNKIPLPGTRPSSALGSSSYARSSSRTRRSVKQRSRESRCDERSPCRPSLSLCSLETRSKLNHRTALCLKQLDLEASSLAVVKGRVRNHKLSSLAGSQSFSTCGVYRGSRRVRRWLGLIIRLPLDSTVHPSLELTSLRMFQRSLDHVKNVSCQGRGLEAL